MQLRKNFPQVLLLFTVISLCLPVRVLAYDLKDQTINYLVRTKNSLNKVYTTVGTKLEKKVPKISLKPKKLDVVINGVSANFGTALSDTKNIFKKNNEVKNSNLYVGRKSPRIEMMINNQTSKQYYIDSEGFIFCKPGIPEDFNKSREYSQIIDKLINGNKMTMIYDIDRFGGAVCISTNKASVQIVAIDVNNPCTVKKTVGNFSVGKADFDLAHELTHALRRDQGLADSKINKIKYNHCSGGIKLPFDEASSFIEEACAINLENKIRHGNGYEIRDDGSRFEDVNKDGIPDGDGRYGEHFNNVTGPNWFDDFLMESKYDKLVRKVCNFFN